MKQTVHVEIAGQKLSIKSDEGTEYVQALADYVDAHLRELHGGKQTSYNLQRMALLVSIQIADELFREKDLRQRFMARVQSKVDTLSERIDEHEQRLVALD